MHICIGIGISYPCMGNPLCPTPDPYAYPWPIPPIYTPLYTPLYMTPHRAPLRALLGAIVMGPPMLAFPGP